MLNDGLLRYKDGQKFALFDQETEGLNLFYHRPFQIGWIIATLKEVLEEHSAYILWPDIFVSDEAARITRFDKHKYLKEARPAAEVLQEFDAALYDEQYLIAGHNIIAYDCYIHRNWQRACGKLEDFSWMKRLYDTHCLAKAFKKGWQPDRANFLGWQYKMSGYIERGLKTSLASLNKDMGIGHDESGLHDARVDLRLNWEVLKKLVWGLEV